MEWDWLLWDPTTSTSTCLSNCHDKVNASSEIRLAWHTSRSQGTATFRIGQPQSAIRDPPRTNHQPPASQPASHHQQLGQLTASGQVAAPPSHHSRYLDAPPSRSPPYLSHTYTNIWAHNYMGHMQLGSKMIWPASSNKSNSNTTN